MKYAKRFVFFIAFIVVIAVLRYTGLGSYFTLENLKGQREALRHIVEQRYPLSVLSYVGVYIITVSLSLPVAALLTVASGFLFGIIPGALYTNIGATIGSVFSFLIVRYLIGAAVQKKYATYLQAFNKEMEVYGVFYLLIIRMIAVIPFFVANAVIALTQVPLRTFIWTTSLGILPSSFVFAFAGRQLCMIESIKDIFSGYVALAFGLLALLAFVPVLIKKIMRK